VTGLPGHIRTLISKLKMQMVQFAGGANLQGNEFNFGIKQGKCQFLDYETAAVLIDDPIDLVIEVKVERETN
jgi:hypothetical protein